MVTEAPYRVEMHNGIQQAHCPYCSQAYPFRDEKGNSQDVPRVCRRCSGPMDYDKAVEFANEQAELAARPQARGLHQPPRHTQVREAINKVR